MIRWGDIWQGIGLEKPRFRPRPAGSGGRAVTKDRLKVI
jgi:hypothetical protein